jgi:hypothetical protein
MAATYAGVNTFVEQAGSPVISQSRSDTMTVTRTYRGANDELESFLADYEYGDSDNDYPNTFLTSYNSTQNGPYTLATLTWTGRSASTDATFAPRERKASLENAVQSADIIVSGRPCTITFFVFRDIYTYFVKTRPTSAAPPSSPTGPVAPTLISFTGVNAPVLNTNYQSSEAKEILSVMSSRQRPVAWISPFCNDKLRAASASIIA